jgi:hypothetical protein
MSSATHVSQQIRCLQKAGERGLIPEPLKAWIKTLDHLRKQHFVKCRTLTPFSPFSRRGHSGEI